MTQQDSGKQRSTEEPVVKPENVGNIAPASGQPAAPNRETLPTAAPNEIVEKSDEPAASTKPPIPASQDAGLKSTRPTNVRDILNDPVTAHMGPASPLLRVDHTVEESLGLLRKAGDIGRVVYFYVVDDQRRLQGVVSTRKLLLSSPQTSIADILSTKVVAIPDKATVLEACEFFTLHKLLAFPIIDESRRVLGVVDVDLYTDEILEIDRRQDSDDLFQLIGVHLTPAEQGNAKLAFMGRFPWLLCNVAGGMLAALLADWYQDVSTLVVVAPFIALVTGLSESVSIQSVSLAIQILHREPPSWSSFLRKTGKELFVGLLLGAACGLTVGIVALGWKGDLKLALSLLFGITAGVAASAIVGLGMPYVLKLLRCDPQLAAGPIALALADVVTLLFYFNLGRWLLL